MGLLAFGGHTPSEQSIGDGACLVRAGVVAGPEREYVRFYVTNTGDRLATVQNVGWVRRAGWRRQQAVQLTETRLPLKLAPGENCTILIPWDGKLASQLGYPKSVKAVVHTPIGSKTVRVGPDLRQYFRDQSSVQATS